MSIITKETEVIGVRVETADRILTLPINQYLTKADVETVAGEVLAFLNQ